MRRCALLRSERAVRGEVLIREQIAYLACEGASISERRLIIHTDQHIILSARSACPQNPVPEGGLQPRALRPLQRGLLAWLIDCSNSSYQQLCAYACIQVHRRCRASRRPASRRLRARRGQRARVLGLQLDELLGLLEVDAHLRVLLRHRTQLRAVMRLKLLELPSGLRRTTARLRRLHLRGFGS